MPKEIGLLLREDGLYHLPEGVLIENILAIRKNGKRVDSFKFNDDHTAVDVRHVRKGEIITAIVLY